MKQQERHPVVRVWEDDRQEKHFFQRNVLFFLDLRSRNSNIQMDIKE